MSLKVALVTGGNRGIGLEIVHQLASQGIRVALGSRDRSKGMIAVSPFISLGLSVSVVQLDVNLPSSIEAAVKECRDKFGKIDILINNAAILQEGAQGFNTSVLDVSDEKFIETFTTNLLGPLRLIREVLPEMIQKNYGRIVNISSLAGQSKDMDKGFPAYRISKAALNALTQIVAAECYQKNIKVNAASPGWVRTSLGGPEAELSPEEGADTPVWLATLPDNGPSGAFFEKRKIIAW